MFVSSAHLRSGTALTDEGLLLGNMAFRSVSSRPAGIANFEPCVLTCPRSARHYRASVPKVRIDQGSCSLKKAPVLNGKGP
jgi:hypothetical protein